MKEKFGPREREAFDACRRRLYDRIHDLGYLPDLDQAGSILEEVIDEAERHLGTAP